MVNYSDIVYNLLLEEYPQKKDNELYSWCMEAIVYIISILRIPDYFNGEFYQVMQGNFEDNERDPLLKIKDISKLYDKNISQGNDKSDITLCKSVNYDEKCIVPESCKFPSKNKLVPDNSDCQKLVDTLRNDYNSDNLPLLITNDKNDIINHKYHKDKGRCKEIHKNMEKQKLIFDLKDIKKWYQKFNEIFKDLDKTQNKNDLLHEFSEKVNSEILKNTRVSLELRLHQSIAVDIMLNNNDDIILSHASRSGKSITLLEFISKSKYKKVLFWTPVKTTINQFIDEIKKFENFKNIKYIILDGKNIEKIDTNFNGIYFTTCQFLKNDEKNKKKKFLETTKFDLVCVDESHLHSCSDKTDKMLFNIIKSLCLNCRRIFMSATSTKTIQKFKKGTKIPWTLEDTGFMKALESDISNSKKEEIIELMKSRHKNFEKHYNNPLVNKDYSKFPLPYFWKLDKKSMNILQTLIDNYNLDNDEDLGISIKSLFQLKSKIVKIKNKDGKIVKKKIYLEKFKLDTKTNKKILIGFLELLYKNDDPGGKSLLNKISEELVKNESRDCECYIIYTPGLGDTNIFHKTLKKFIEDNELFEDYEVTYSNSSLKKDALQKYNEGIEICERNKKQGLIMFLNQQGGVGNTYKKCDCVIMLDDSINPDEYYQRLMRCMTDDDNKKIAIIVDMNWSRQLKYIRQIIRDSPYKNIPYKDIIKYYIEYNIFRIQLSKTNFNFEAICIDETVQEISKEINSLTLDDTLDIEFTNNDIDNLCDNFKIDDGLDTFSVFMGNGQNIKAPKKNKKLLDDPVDKSADDPKNNTIVDQGNNQDDNQDDNQEVDSDCADTHEDDTDIYDNIRLNIKAIFKSIIYLLIILTSFDNRKNILNIKNIYESLEENEINIVKQRIYDKIKDKKVINDSHLKIKVYNNIINIMINIHDDQNIIELKQKILDMSHIDRRDFIEKNVIPSKEEMAERSEYPTCMEQCKEFVDSVPREIYLEGTAGDLAGCGKGNIILCLFDKYNEILKDIYENDAERCRVIINERLYFGDITEENVYFTKILLNCYALAECDIEQDYKFNCYSGESIVDLNCNDNKLHKDYKKFKNSIDICIINPPYTPPNAIGTGNAIWQNFIKESFIWIKPKGYLVAIHPPGWRKPSTESGRYYGIYNMLVCENTMINLTMYTSKMTQKLLHGAQSRTDWYTVKLEKPSKDHITNVKDIDGNIHKINLQKYPYLLNNNFDLLDKLIRNNIDNSIKMDSIVKFTYNKNEIIGKIIKITDKMYNIEYISGDKGSHTDIFRKNKDKVELVNSNIELVNNKLDIIHTEKYAFRENNKNNVIKNKNETYNIPVINKIFAEKKKNKIIIPVKPELCYTNSKDIYPDIFVPKIIFSSSCIKNPFYDKKGEYATSQQCSAIIVKDEDEAEKILKCLKSDSFNEFIKKSAMWGNYGIDYMLFISFNKNFYDNFI